jgi:hypothetical protein
MTSTACRNTIETQQHQPQSAAATVVEEVNGSLFPTRLDALHNKGVLQVHSGFNCSMASALTEDGDLYLWGTCSQNMLAPYFLTILLFSVYCLTQI